MNEVKFGMNKYCGPAVLSILTGKSTDECASVISAVNGKYDVRGITIDELIKAAKKLRFELKPVNTYGYSLYGSVVHLVNTSGMYLVAVPKHFVAIEVKDGVVSFCDNHTKEPINAASAARMSQKVLGIYRADKLPDPVFVRSEYVITKNEYYSGSLSVSFKRIDHYENPTDNIAKSLGYLSIESEAELASVQKEFNNLASKPVSDNGV